MVGARGLAVVAHNLEPPDHLADGEEAEALGGHDARGDELGVAEAEAAALRGLEGLGRGLEEGAGAAGEVPSALVEGLEGGDGATLPLVLVFSC